MKRTTETARKGGSRTNSSSSQKPAAGKKPSTAGPVEPEKTESKS